MYTKDVLEKDDGGSGDVAETSTQPVCLLRGYSDAEDSTDEQEE